MYRQMKQKQKRKIEERKQMQRIMRRALNMEHLQ